MGPNIFNTKKQKTKTKTKTKRASELFILAIYNLDADPTFQLLNSSKS